MIRLQKFLAECGVASRRQAESYIAGGRVRVNGKVAAVGDKVDPGADTIELDGAPVNRDRKVYVVLHKPKGVVTSAKDTHKRRTVFDCLDGVTARVFPVGRLDMDVTGALLLTNDGLIAHRLAHPKFQVDKVYVAWVNGCVTAATAEALSEGIELDDGPTAPAKVTVLKANDDSSRIQLVIHEGRKRLVKRMCAAVGHPVRDLRRLAVGPIRADGLIPGEWRYLSEQEIATLKDVTASSGS
ncbi:MAG: pseudouridine synthase [Candidatus Hydrogenedentes bacterium]|nr:pseudouridine synthase [Candidatus Hydrogenedentota bacterium]